MQPETVLRSQSRHANQTDIERTMVKRTSHKEAGCALARPLDAIGDGWSLLIVRDAFDGLRRFGEFQRSLGLARNILSARLRNLVDHGVLQAVAAADGGAHCEYVLTEKGRGLFPLMVALRQWGEDYFFEADRPRARLVERQTGEAVGRLEIRARNGRTLTADDTVTRLEG